MGIYLFYNFYMGNDNSIKNQLSFRRHTTNVFDLESLGMSFNSEKDLINYIKRKNINHDKWKKNPTSLFNELKNHECRLIEFEKKPFREVNVIQIFIADTQVNEMLVEFYQIE